MDILFGIDFGTTNTVISYFENNKVKEFVNKFFEVLKNVKTKNRTALHNR